MNTTILIYLFLITIMLLATVGSMGNAASQITLDKARFTVISPQCIRLEYSPSGEFIDAPSYFAYNRKARYSAAKIEKNADSVQIDTGVIKLSYKNDGKAFDADNLKVDIGSSIAWHPGILSKANMGGAIRTLDVVDGCVKLDDGVISRDGWYLLDDSKSPLLTKDWVMSRPADSGIDWYFFGYGTDYKSALKSLTAIGGSIPLPRRYTLGAWYSRYWPYTSEDYRQIYKEYSEHDFPLDVMVMDMDWHKDGWTGWSWNRDLLPDAEELLKWFHSKNLAVTLNVHPADGVLPHEDMYADFMKAMGKDPTKDQPLPFDAGNKKYLDTMFKYTHAPLEAEGVDFWWLDWQQYPFTHGIPDLTNLQWLNEYYFKHTSANGKRGVSFSRWAGWGDHRHPIHFSGDSSTNWRMLAFEVPFTSASSNAGCFFWSHDIGGHMSGRNEESYTRWCQFGAFTAALRSHSTRDATMDRRPWAYEKWAEDSMRISFHIRSIFFPYTYSSVRQSTVDSVPLVRGMYIDYPNSDAAYKQPQQYMYGDDILVSPVAEPGVGRYRLARQVVWFPEGDWYNYFTGEKYDDNSEHLVTAGINEFPLYIRGGVPVPLQAYTQHMATQPLNELIIRCYPGDNGKIGSFTLYEDDGITDAYKKKESATTVLKYRRDGEKVTISVDPTKGEYKGQLSERSYKIELPCTLEITDKKTIKQGMTLQYNKNTNINTIHVPAKSIREGFSIVLKVENVAPQTAHLKAFASRVGLPAPVPGDSLSNLLETALASSGDLSPKMILASAGVGSVDKIETAYGFPDTKTVRTYTSPLIHATVEANLIDSDDEGQLLQTVVKIGGKQFEYEEPRNQTVDLSRYEKENAALSATVTASSFEFPETDGVNDGFVGGYPIDRSQEWSTKGEKASAWIKLDWTNPQTVDRILLFDRLNGADRVLAGEIEFSDGSKVAVGELVNNATKGTLVKFAPKIITWLKFTVTKVSNETQNTGLAEIVVLRAK